MNTFFDLPERQKYTSKSDVNRNQIDYILIRDRFKNSIKKCKTYPKSNTSSNGTEDKRWDITTEGLEEVTSTLEQPVDISSDDSDAS